MIYNKLGFIFLLVFIVLFLFSIFIIRKFKSLPIVLPNKGNLQTLKLIHYILIFLIMFIIIIIPFNIGIYQGTTSVKKSTLNIEVLFDVSLSMTSKDFTPDRFTVAKNSLIQFIKGLDTNYNIGMISFSGKPFVYIPISNDKKALIWKIENMKMSDFPPTLDFVGTAIGDAIILGIKKLEDYTSKKESSGVILLFTDGDSNKGLDVNKAIKYAKEKKIPIFVGAIGKDKSYLVGKDLFGNNVPTKINIQMLKNIAKQTGGKFVQIESKEDFLKVLSYLQSYIKNYEKIQKIQNYLFINYYLKYVLIILLISYLIFLRFDL